MTTTTAAPAISPTHDHEVPLWRLYLMRAMAVFFVLQGVFNIWPNVLFPSDPAARGMNPSFLAGLWVLAVFAIRYPLQLLPIFLFECVWKTIWLLAFGLPQYFSGVGSPRLMKDMFDIGLFGIVFALLIPWGFVWRHYVLKPSERWR